MATIGSLVVKLAADSREFSKGLETARQDLSGFAGRASSAIGGILGLGAGGALGFGVKLAAEAEQAKVAFTTMLGSGQAAAQLLQEITAFAASTPFEIPELRNAAKSLTAFGVSAQDVIPTLTAIGDISSGIGAPIGEIAELYGKAKVQGRLFAQDINQLTGRGIPIIQQLARQFGVTENAVKKLVESGAVNFNHLETAFKNLTKEGGTFGGLMAAQSKTLAGQWSNLKDTISQALSRTAELIVPAIKQALEWGRAILTTAAALGAVKVALWAAAAAQKAFTTAAIFAQAIAGGPAGWGKIALAIAAASTAAALVNRAMDQTGSTAKRAAAEVRKVAEAMGEVGGAATGLNNAAAKIDHVAERFRQLQMVNAGSKLDKAIRAEIASTVDGLLQLDAVLPPATQKINDLKTALASVEKIAADIGAGKAAELRDALADAIGDASGFAAAFESAQIEMAKASGTLTDIDVALRKVADAGALPEQVAQLKEVLTQTKEIREEAEKHSEAQRKVADMLQRGQSITEQFATPIETAAKKAAELQELLKAGAITETTFGRAMAAMGNKPEAHGQAHSANAAAQHGTAESYSAIQSSFRLLAAPNKSLEQIAQAQLAEAKKQTAAIEKSGEHTIVIKDFK